MDGVGTKYNLAYPIPTKDDYRSCVAPYVDGETNIQACHCVGPQPGYPVCPCRMRNLRKIDGRWIETIDHGPVLPTPPKPKEDE